MANLETLELTISANADSASQGIASLTRSLSALSSAVGKSVGGLMRLNAELKTLKGYGALKLPNLSQKTGASSIVGKAKKIVSDYDPEHNNGRGVDVSKLEYPSKVPDDVYNKNYKKAMDEMHKEHQQRIADNKQYRQRIQEEAKAAAKYAEEQKNQYQQMLQQEKAVMDIRGNDTKDIIEQSTKLDLLTMKYDALKMETISMAREGKLTANQIATRSMQIQKLGQEIEKTKEKMSGMKEETKKLQESAKENISGMSKPINKVTSSAGRLISTIGRIFKTMLIRSAIRALLKGAKEGLDNFYQYSKTIGTSYASTMDSISSKWGQIKNQIGAGLGTALSAVLPILNAIASAALTAFNALTALFALIGGGSTYSAATEGMNSYGDAIKGAGGAASKWLATFDELNVMTSGGGGGGGGAANIGSMFEEVEIPQWMKEWKGVIEALLAGTLGALILPKIFDWIKKIFGLFSGTDAKNALDILKKMFKLKDTNFDDGSNGLDNFLKKFTDSDVLDGVGEITDLLSTLQKLDWKKLLIENIPELLKLAITALTKLLEGMNIKTAVKVDRKEYDKFIKDYKKDKKDITEWLAEDSVKKILVQIDFGAFSPLKIALIDAWTKETATKNIDVVIDDDVAKITKLTQWISSVEEKNIKVNIDDDIAKITQLTIWASTDETKTINVKIDPDIATITKLTLWTATEDKKKIKVVIDNDIAMISKINIWTSTVAEKVIDIFVDNMNYLYKIQDWIEDVPQKWIQILFIDNFQGLLNIQKWIDEEATKIINIKFNVEGNNPSSSPSTSTGGSSFWSDLVGTLSLNTNQIINKIVGKDILPSEGIIPNIIKKVFNFKANGGFVDSGDLFVANEGGNAELIGKFGNQTGVANQDQIVSGISQGVSDANREQNALLMQQNNLLREILNKDTSVRIGASAALGRVARQSINMYSSMIGG